MVRNLLRSRTRKVTFGLVVLAIFAAVGIAFHLRAVHQAQQKSGNVASVNKETKPKRSSPKKDQSVTGDTTPNTTSQKSPGSAVASSGDLIAPFGSFVSNHRPGQNGTSTSEESVCSTTSGASCYIQFTKDGIVKKLPAKAVDGSGNALWDWDIRGSELGPGSWQVAAVATLNGQTKTTVDPNGQLEVK